MDDQTRHKFLSDGVSKLTDNNQNKRTHSVDCQSEMRAMEEKESEGGYGALGWESGEQGEGYIFSHLQTVRGWESRKDTWESALAAVRRQEPCRRAV